MKKLIPAICMTLLAAAMFASSTFAWFSMNTTVTATGMQVTAKTDNAFLIIKEGTTLSGSATTATDSIDATLYPVHPMTTLTSANIETVTNWGTATSDDINDANVGAVLTPLAGDDTLSNYVAKQSYMVGIVAGSGAAANDLTLKTLTISDVNDGITVVVVCGTNIYTYTANVANGTDRLAEKTAVTTSGVQVDVYIYIDGANANVYTANATNLGGSVDMTFTIDAVS